MTFKVGSVGFKNGKPAISWHRPGVAAKGEPSTVSIVQEYPDVDARDEAILSGSPSPSLNN